MHLPAVRTLVFYGIGLAIVFGLEEVDLSISWWACIPWALLLWSTLGFASLAPFTHPRIWTVSILLYVLISGVLCAAVQQSMDTAESDRFQILDVVDKATLEIEGTLERVERRLADQEVEWVLWTRVHAMDTVNFVRPVRARLSHRQALDECNERVNRCFMAHEGQTIAWSIEVRQSHSPRVPGTFHYPTWLKQQGVVLTGTVLEWSVDWDELQHMESIDDAKPMMLRVRESIRQSIDQRFSEQASEFVHAFVLGDRSRMDQDQKQAFSNSGLSHIMAVSGLHVGLLVAPFWVLFPLVAPKKHLAATLWMTLLILLLGYCALTGWSVSVQRASMMTLIMATTRCFMMQRIAVQTLAVAALFLLLKNPQEVFQAGFQLSFGAVFGLLTWMQAIQQGVYRTIPTPPLRWVIQLMSVSVIAQFVNFPILASWFGSVSWISPIANLAVIPFLGIAMPATIVTLLTPESALAWVPIHTILTLFFEYVLEISTTFGTSQWTVSTPSWPAWAIACWALGAAILRPQVSPHTRWRGILVLCTILAGAGVLKTIEKAQPAPFQVWMLDVGQGDAFVIQTPSEQVYILDAGLGGWGMDSAERVILPFLAHQGIHHIEGLILSHAHADHIGGAKTILQRIPVDTVYVGRGFESASSNMAQEIHKMTSAPRQTVRTLAAGEIFWLGACCPSIVLAPFYGSEGILEPPSSNINNQSLVFKTYVGDQSILWTGDAEKESEQTQVSWATPLLPSTILKTGHHGSRTSTSPSYLEQVRPSIAMTSVGLRNRYRLPNQEVAARFDSINVTHLTTSLHGTVHLQTDGQKIRILLE
ncbi:MAG: DNA internalization-related competence protein ComEC/Rec2 [Bacteroidetes bacterium]|nr:DNA internalization-related competence protein ComEC/Rec2 [Bacteroidota bacterium]